VQWGFPAAPSQRPRDQRSKTERMAASMSLIACCVGSRSLSALPTVLVIAPKMLSQMDPSILKTVLGTMSATF